MIAKEAQMDALETVLHRLERLETLEATRSCLYRYAEGVDGRDWGLLASAFAEDAVLAMPGSQVVGRDAIVEGLRGMLPPEFVTRHLVVNPRVDYVAEGRARAHSTIYYAHEGSGFEATGWGDYVDEVAVVDGVGLITRKEFVPAQHLPGSLARANTRLAELETAELAREASWRYATAIDTLDFILLESVFTEDAVLVTRKGPREGRDAIIEYYRTALTDPVTRRHFLVNQKVTSSGPGTALLESYFLYTFAGADTSILGWGSYIDRVRVIDGVGYIEEKRISVDVHSDVREGWAT
jgi:ketosteroid isomerase-like protein